MSDADAKDRNDRQRAAAAERPGADELREVAPRVPEVADRVRLVGLDRALTVGRARVSALAREEARRAARLGDDAPEVEEAAGRRERLRRRLVQGRAVVRVAETGLELKGDQAVVFGRVADATGRPLAGVSLHLGGEANADGSHFGETESDEAGFYASRVPAAELARRLKSAGELVLVAHGGPLLTLHREQRPAEDPRVRVWRVDLRLAGVKAPGKEPPTEKTPKKTPPPVMKAPGKAPEKVAKKAPADRVPVTEIPGVGPVRARRLAGAGVESAEQVAAMSAERLAEALDVPPASAERILTAARRVVEER